MGTTGITFFLPFLMFIFLLALGEDYNILVMTRIRRKHDGFRCLDAVVQALRATGTTVTSAGLVLAGTFAVFAIVGSQSMGSDAIDVGVGLAIGVLMDTFLVRTLIVPSIVVLLGRWNWWPSKLGLGRRSRWMLRCQCQSPTAAPNEGTAVSERLTPDQAVRRAPRRPAHGDPYASRYSPPSFRKVRMQPVEAPARDTSDAGGGAPMVEVEDLRKTYPGGKTAVDGVSFAVGAGEIFGLLGPNGSGKTTTVRILVTLLRKTSGVSRVGGFDTDKDAPRVRRLIGYAAQSTGIDDDLTVHENLALKGVLYGLTPREVARRAEEVTAAFSLTDVANQRAGRFSGGMRRRLDLAVALLNKPPVCSLDEPTTGLDPQSRNAVWDLLRGLSKDGMTIFLTTQYLEEADLACDRVPIIDQGRLVTIGTPAPSRNRLARAGSC